MLVDIIRETWFYKDIYQKGVEAGREEARQEGIAQLLRLAVLDVVQVLFPEIADFVEEKIASIKDPMVLRWLIVKLSALQTAEKVRQYIEELGKEDA